jgi:hypothetical protein
MKIELSPNDEVICISVEGFPKNIIKISIDAGKLYVVEINNGNTTLAHSRLLPDSIYGLEDCEDIDENNDDYEDHKIPKPTKAVKLCEKPVYIPPLNSPSGATYCDRLKGHAGKHCDKYGYSRKSYAGNCVNKVLKGDF